MTPVPTPPTSSGSMPNPTRSSRNPAPTLALSNRPTQDRPNPGPKPARSPPRSISPSASSPRSRAAGELIVISDFQATAWRDFHPALPPDIDVRTHRVATAAPPNARRRPPASATRRTRRRPGHHPARQRAEFLARPRPHRAHPRCRWLAPNPVHRSPAMGRNRNRLRAPPGELRPAPGHRIHRAGLLSRRRRPPLGAPRARRHPHRQLRRRIR